MKRDFSLFWLIRMATFPFSFLPLFCIRSVGKGIGFFAFYLMGNFRRRSLSNLAIAQKLNIGDEKELKKIALRSFQNLAINCLEYPLFSFRKNLSRYIRCENPEKAAHLYKEGKGMIFFCGHQSNWEALFLDGTARMDGVAIGKPTKNKRLYQWIVSIREKFGGKIVAPRNGMKEGLKALRRGAFFGIVGDQGMPDSGYSFPFLGRRAFSSTAPALLSYKTGSPLLVATTRRTKTGYLIRYSDPIFPNPSLPIEEEVRRMMDESLHLLEKSIEEAPHEWLWQHNRWKQQTPHVVYKRFRHDTVGIILPSDPRLFRLFLPSLATFREIYPQDFLSIQVASSLQSELNSALFCSQGEILPYDHPDQVLRRDYRLKIVFDLSDHPLAKRHFSRLAAFEVINYNELYERARPYLLPAYTLSDILRRALCRPHTTWTPRDPYFHRVK